MEQFFVDFLGNLKNSQEWIYLLRILIACLCGGIIGIERTFRQKDAGLRTHLIVALGAAVMMIVSKYGFADTADFDAARVASNIITGVSFLGAGMIFVKGFNIKGLTTAAGIWSTAAVSMAIASGLYITGILSTVLILFVQVIFHTFLIGFDKTLANDTSLELVIRIKNTTNAIQNFKKLISELELSAEESKISLGDDGYFTIVLTVKADRGMDLPELIAIFNLQDDIQAVTLS